MAQKTSTKQKTESTFAAHERKLITDGKGTMHVYLVTDEKELAVLTTISEDLNPTDPLVQKLSARMLATVQDEAHAGVGIAAPQVGINKNLILVQRFDKARQPFESYINPKIIWRSTLLRTGAEGCLSIPDRREEVERSYAIRLQYALPTGDVIEENVEGFTAVIFQHEIDHLFGVLYPDRVDEQEATPSTSLNTSIKFSAKDGAPRL
ncbi:peptide deformylase [Sphingobacterium corticibacter]|uniref:Peptide deformylase n=1 Tax=Sphingobacterium corticibacter TaxID=2171749 RepID=A0A2T8HKV0_9SPHI|nr:peptide deformylase [Sphingobacterium corticibacter]PVH26013.1 peptide deformylase [Sphingobacterium corticibacter]